jgi:CBS domain-containing protein
MKVREIMSTDMLFLLEENTIAEAVKLFGKRNIGGAPVIDKDGNLIGMLTDADIFKGLRLKYKQYNISFPTGVGMPSVDFKSTVQYTELKKAYKDLAQTKVKDLMISKVVVAKADDHIEVIVPLLVDNKINRLPVVEKGKVVGIVSRGDIIRTLLVD